MIAGYDRYAQIVKCFRDEDLRADREPEFTQIGVEMSFIDREDIFGMMEGLMARVFRDMLGVEVPRPFPRMSYREAMDRVGGDKPDTRFGLEVTDYTKELGNTGFRVFADVVAKGGVIRGITAPGLRGGRRAELAGLGEGGKGGGAGGGSWGGG